MILNSSPLLNRFSLLKGLHSWSIGALVLEELSGVS